MNDWNKGLLLGMIIGLVFLSMLAINLISLSYKPETEEIGLDWVIDEENLTVVFWSWGLKINETYKFHADVIFEVDTQLELKNVTYDLNFFFVSLTCDVSIIHSFWVDFRVTGIFVENVTLIEF